MLSLLQPPTWLLHVMVYEAVSKGLTYSSHQSIECSRKSLLTQQRTAFILFFLDMFGAKVETPWFIIMSKHFNEFPHFHPFPRIGLIGPSLRYTQ